MKRSRKADGADTDAEQKPHKKARAKKAGTTASPTPAKEVVKSNDVTSPAQTAPSKQLKKSGKIARAPVDQACWLSAKGKGIAKDCYEAM